MREAVITIDDMNFAYGGTPFELSLDSFIVADRERVALIGASGCGKTTLLDLIAGIKRPVRGSISTAGHDLSGMTSSGCREMRLQSMTAALFYCCLSFMLAGCYLLEEKSCLDISRTYGAAV